MKSQYAGSKTIPVGVLFLTTFAIMPAFAAGAPAPLPVAGALGPWGLGIAAAAYGGYRFVQYLRRK